MNNFILLMMFNCWFSYDLPNSNTKTSWQKCKLFWKTNWSIYRYFLVISSIFIDIITTFLRIIGSSIDLIHNEILRFQFKRVQDFLPEQNWRFQATQVQLMSCPDANVEKFVEKNVENFGVFLT